VLHVSIWEIEIFSGGLSGDGTEFWAPRDSVGRPQLGVWSAADTALATGPTLKNTEGPALAHTLQEEVLVCVG